MTYLIYTNQKRRMPVLEITFAIVIAILLLTIGWLYYVNNIVRWDNIKEYEKVYKKYGKPNYLDPRPGGFAIWNHRSVFTQITVGDEMKFHSDTKYTIPFAYKNDLEYLYNVSPNLTYNPTDYELTIQSDNLVHVVAAMATATDLRLGELLPTSVKDVQAAFRDNFTKLSDPVVLESVIAGIEKRIVMKA